MKKSNFFATLFLLVITTCMVAFVSPAGGEGYEIYLDNKLIIQQFGKQMKEVKNLQLNSSHIKSELGIKFYHCGMAGKSRTLELKINDKQIVKKWQFANSSDNHYIITVPVKEIINLEKKSATGTFDLYYASKEAPQGRKLAEIILTDRATAKR